MTQYKNKIQFYIYFFAAVFVVCVFVFSLSTDVYAASNQSTQKGGMDATYDLTGAFTNPVTAAIAWLFVGIIRLFGFFIVMGVSLIKFSLSENFLVLLNNEAIYIGWKSVRDVLNLFFIFFLLYSAFCTIFQISRYHIKSTWVMIVVMALLVNFSWPIAHVLVDASNVAMMYVIGDGNGVDSNTLLSKFASESGIMKIILENKSTGITVEGNTVDIEAGTNGLLTQLLIGIITTALFAFTIGFVGILLILRVLLLAIYMIFSAVGFTMAAFPSTKSYANKWWEGLTKQLVLGPLVLFALLLATLMLEAVNKSTVFKDGLMEAASKNGAAGNFMSYLISIAMIWACVLAAQDVSGKTAGIAMKWANKAKNTLKAGGMGLARTGDYAMARMTNRMANSENGAVKSVGRGFALARSVPQRIDNYKKGQKKAYESELEESIAHGTNVAPGLIGGDKDAVNAMKGKKIEAKKKSMKETPLNQARDIKLEARAQLLAEQKNDLRSDEVEELIKTFGELDPDTVKAVKKKMRDSGFAHMTMDHEMELMRKNPDHSGKTPEEMRKIVVENIYGKMDGKTLAKQGVVKSYHQIHADDARYQDMEAMFDALNERQNSFSRQSKQNFREAQGREGQQVFADAQRKRADMERRRTERTVGDAAQRERTETERRNPERAALRDMNT